MHVCVYAHVERGPGGGEGNAVHTLVAQQPL